MAEAHIWAPTTVAGPTDFSLTRANVVARSALVVLIMIARCTSATTVSELGEKPRLLFTGPGGYTQWGHR